jgi:hypothetical protein
MVLVFSIHSMNQIELSPNQKYHYEQTFFYQDTWIWDIWQAKRPTLEPPKEVFSIT